MTDDITNRLQRVAKRSNEWLSDEDFDVMQEAIAELKGLRAENEQLHKDLLLWKRRKRYGI